MNNPTMGAPSNPNRPHEVGEDFLNPTVEIELDEWMRLSVSSLTLTKVIKSHTPTMHVLAKEEEFALFFRDFPKF
jgi:hypothetical protein